MERSSTGQSVRQPAVAGMFYPADAERLLTELNECLGGSLPDAASNVGDLGEPFALIAPHAGIRYSGPFAVKAHALNRRPRTAVILGPAHRGASAPIALSSADSWLTPFGAALVDRGLCDLIERDVPEAASDDQAHQQEHSIELQVVCRQWASGPDSPIVPIAISTPQLSSLATLSNLLASVAQERDLLLIASTDLSHYLPDAQARDIDVFTVSFLQNLDSAGLLEAVARREATLCGLWPVVAIMDVARQIGATSARLVAYGTSAETGGPPDEVVGYASLAITA